MESNPTKEKGRRPIIPFNNYSLYITYKDINKKLNSSKSFVNQFNNKPNNDNFNINIDDKEIKFEEFIYDNPINKEKAKFDDKTQIEKNTNIINKIDKTEKRIDDDKKNIKNNDINNVNYIIIDNVNKSNINKSNNINNSNINIDKVNNNDVNKLKNNDINYNIDKSGKYNNIINKYNNSIEKGDSTKNINSKQIFIFNFIVRYGYIKSNERIPKTNEGGPQ